MRILEDQRILKALCCPICRSGMMVKGNSLVCTGIKNHCYDFASSGYVNLCAPSQSGGGDSKQAVRARSEFLNGGYYEPVAKAVEKMCEKWTYKDSLIVDAGCGEGYYSSFLPKHGFSVFGVDLSKFAVDAASKRLSKTQCYNFFFATASVFEIPLLDSSVGTVTNIFAPCSEAEYSRVLKNDGVLIVAYAGEKHLMGLKNAIYDIAHTNSERADLPAKMLKIDECRVTYPITLNSNEHIMSLFAMTPYYWRTSPSDGEKLKKIYTLTTDVDIVISVYRNCK